MNTLRDAVMAELMLMLRGYSVDRVTNTENWLIRYRENWLKKNKERERKEIEKMFCLLEEVIAQEKLCKPVKMMT